PRHQPQADCERDHEHQLLESDRGHDQRAVELAGGNVLMVSARPSSERGFTLVELVLAIAIGLIVSFLLFTILDVTWRGTSRSVTMIDATASARVTLAKLDDELQSACLTSGVTPIQPGSTGSTLLFLSAYGKAVQPTPIEHQISYSASTNSLTDSLYAVTGGAAPDWTFSGTPYATNVLLSNVKQAGNTPVFQYFAYQEVPNGSGGYYADADGNPYMM